MIQPTAARQRPPATVPTDLYVCPFTVAADTREQAPWGFQNITTGGKLWLVKRQVCTLQTGDYSIVGYESQVVIERKSAEDFLGSITAGNARFRREHERAAEIVKAGGFACVVIEGCMAAICDELDSPNSERRMTSETVIGIVASWPRRYGVHWLFAGDRRRAELLAFRILVKWHQEHGGQQG
jgi:ERCC4-type nuclease